MENTKKQLWILVTVCLFTFMSVLDSSIVNIALPTISKELEITLTHSEWIVSSYLLVICCSLLLFGKLGDTFGKAKIFKIGGVIFIIGSALCGFSNSLPMLVVSRIIQAVGSGMTMSNNNGIITETFAPNQRGRALGMVGAFVSLGAITGPGLGGLLLAQFSWNSIFLVNVPIGIIGVLLGYRILPVRKRTGKERIDYLGFILLALTILSMYASIQFIQSGNIFQWPVFIFTGLFLGSCYFFLHWENRIEKPLLQLSLFSNKIFSESLLSAFLVFISAFFYTMIMPFYLQDIKGYTARDAGLIMMVFPIVQVILAPIAGYLADRYDKRKLTILGLFLLTLGQASYFLWQLDTTLTIIIPSIVLSSIGNSFFQAPNNTVIMNTVDPKFLGIAGALNALARNLGMVLGVALSTLILTVSITQMNGKAVTSLTANPSYFVQGMHLAFGFSAILCTIAFLLTLFSAKKSKK